MICSDASLLQRPVAGRGVGSGLGFSRDRAAIAVCCPVAGRMGDEGCDDGLVISNAQLDCRLLPGELVVAFIKSKRAPASPTIAAAPHGAWFGSMTVL